jgi:hypothetical protein
MRVLVAKDRQIIPGQEKLFQRLVLKNAQELTEIDAWLRENIPSYAEEMANNPILDWQKESESDLFDSSEKYGTGEVFYDDEPYTLYYNDRSEPHTVYYNEKEE